MGEIYFYKDSLIIGMVAQRSSWDITSLGSGTRQQNGQFLIPVLTTKEPLYSTLILKCA